MHEPAELREALAAVLGVGVVVSKARRLFMLEGVRIHLDRVDRLGEFIELEGVVADGDHPDSFVGLFACLQQKLGIREEDLLQEGYSDLLSGHSRLPD